MESVGAGRVRDRQWKVTSDARMVGYAEVVCRIYLGPTGVLTTASVENLVLRGLAASRRSSASQKLIFFRRHVVVGATGAS